ncbi:hypothetical protein VTI28DRAFT_6965 [Corynascus sepedonium]
MQTSSTSFALSNQGLQMGQNHGAIHMEFHPSPSLTRAELDERNQLSKPKGGLLADSYRWVLSSVEFRRWHDDEGSRLLWIKGDSGKGKTMLLCGIINELKLASDSNLLSFFFCQAADASINNAMAVLRGLIYLLVDQQPSLISHVHKKYDTTGNPLFRETSLVYSGVKWIVSRRNWPSIENHFSTATQKRRLQEKRQQISLTGSEVHYRNEEPEWIIQKPVMADNWSSYIQTLEGHRGSVSSVAWSYDSTRLASASADKTVKIWDPVTGHCMSALEGHSSFVSSVAWSHDSTWLASASYDGTINIWDTATDQCMSTLEGHSSYIDSVAWSYDSTRLASASADKTVKIWDPVTGHCMSALEGHSSFVSSVAWSHDSTWLASASYDGTINIWDTATDQCMSTLEGHSSYIDSVAWSYDSNRLASVSNYGAVKLWDTATGQYISALAGYTNSHNPVAWSYGSAWLASVSNGNEIKVRGMVARFNPASVGIQG